MKNILIILPSIRCGGQEKVALKTGKLLSKYYNIYLLVLFNGEEELNTQDLNVIKGKNITGGTLIAKILNYLYLIMQISKIKKDKHISVSISFATAANLLNITTKRH